MLKAANTRETVRMALLSERADGALAYNPAQSVELSVSGNEFSRLEKTFDYRPPPTSATSTWRSGATAAPACWSTR